MVIYPKEGQEPFAVGDRATVLDSGKKGVVTAVGANGTAAVEFEKPPMEHRAPQLGEEGFWLYVGPKEPPKPKDNGKSSS